MFQIELSKSYGLTEWKDDLKKLLMKAGVENKPMVFLFVDTQVYNSFSFFVFVLFYSLLFLMSEKKKSVQDEKCWKNWIPIQSAIYLCYYYYVFLNFSSEQNLILCEYFQAPI